MRHALVMPLVDLVDDTFVVAAPRTLAGIVADPVRWARWWPELMLTTTWDRGDQGRQWSVAGRYVGSAEIWLEQHRDGTIVHLYLRLDPAGGCWSPRQAERVRDRLARRWKREVTALKDALEVGRVPGPVKPTEVPAEPG